MKAFCNIGININTLTKAWCELIIPLSGFLVVQLKKISRIRIKLLMYILDLQIGVFTECQSSLFKTFRCWSLPLWMFQCKTSFLKIPIKHSLQRLLTLPPFWSFPILLGYPFSIILTFVFWPPENFCHRYPFWTK